MRKLLISVLLALPAVLGAQTLPVWQPGYLDIHNVATACGDCTFIKMPDGTTMLIDAGDMRGTTCSEDNKIIEESKLKQL